MGRTILSVIVGYLAMFAVVFLSLSLAYLSMGQERAFQPGSYDVSAVWLAVMFAISAIAALAGGFVCASIATGRTAPVALAVAVLVMGLLSAITASMSPPTPAPRQGNIGNLEAMNNARQPAWVALLLPVIGAGGALAGAKLKRQTSPTASSSSPA
jgi:hypothetical protein